MTELLKTFSGRRASQNAFELGCFIDLLKRRNVTSYLEIGAREGDTFHEVMTHLPKGSKGVACDLPGGLWGKVTTGKQLKRVVQALQGLGYDASYVFGDSATPATARIVHMRGPYDAVLIDGDHSYEAVRSDWVLYGQAPIVAFHDIVGTDQIEKRTKQPVEVPQLWQDVKATGCAVVEFVEDGSKMGIGVVLK